jgi:hypothetical protein
MGWIWTTASRDQIIRLAIGNLLLGLVLFLAKAKVAHPAARQCPRIAGTANLSARGPRSPLPLSLQVGWGEGERQCFQPGHASVSATASCSWVWLFLSLPFSCGSVLFSIARFARFESIAPHARSKKKTRSSVHVTILEMGSLQAPGPAEPTAAIRNQ